MNPKANKDDFRDFVLDQLDALRQVTSRRMFGGTGLYFDDTFFGILYDGRLYLKTNAHTQIRYQQAGSDPFQPRGGKTLKHYFNVPVDILEDAETLCEWVSESVQVTSQPL